MAITITRSPQYATTTKPPKLSFTAPPSGGKRVRLFVQDAPTASKFKQELIKTGASRTQVFVGDIKEPFLFEADVPGAYTLVAQEIQVPKFGGGYKGDTRGHLAVGSSTGVEKVLGESTTTIYIGVRVTIPLGVSPNTATLVLWVWGNDVIPTTAELHGEASPDIVDASSAAAMTAATDSTVRARLADLGENPVSTILYDGGTFDTIVDTMIDVLNSHFLNQPSVHGAEDQANYIADAWRSPGGKAAIPDTLTKMLDSLTKHVTTDAANDGVEFGKGTGAWHLGQLADNLNKPLVATASELTDSWVALAEIWRVYMAHRNNTTVHTVADSTSMPSLPLLLRVHEAFLEVVASNQPTPAPDENPGATLLVHAQGATLG